MTSWTILPGESCVEELISWLEPKEYTRLRGTNSFWWECIEFPLQLPRQSREQEQKAIAASKAEAAEEASGARGSSTVETAEEPGEAAEEEPDYDDSSSTDEEGWNWAGYCVKCEGSANCSCSDLSWWILPWGRVW